jgi:hypothetical protein
MHGFHITLGSQFSVGYGSTGKSSDMVAEFRFGVKTNGIPYSCFESPDTSVGSLPNLFNGDAVCVALKWVADKIIAMDGNDVAEMMGGPSMKGSMKYFPFTVAYPKTYEGTTGDNTKMKLLARIPLKLPTEATGSASTSGIDFSKPVCISTLGSKLTQGGGIKKSLQFAGAVLGVVGTDFCFEMPGFKNTGKDLVFGLKVTGTAFDKEKVTLTEFINILPEAWNNMAKDLAGQGIKDLMNAAFTLKPLESCSACTANIPVVDIAMKDLSLDGFFKKMVVANFPDKMTLEIDIGDIVGKVAPDLMTADDKKLFKLPDMFSASRRRRLAIDDALSSQDSFDIEIPAGKLDESHFIGRHLKADSAYAFPTNAYVLEGSKCQFTYTGMPKKINCNLKLQAGPKVTLETSAEVAVAYAVDGTNLEIVSKMGFGLNLGTDADYTAAGVTKDMQDKLKFIDVGGLIDDSLSKTISLAPFSVNFPKGYVEDPTKLFEVARVPVDTIKASGMCISNMEELAPSEMKDAAAALGGTMKKLTGPVGGDVCGQVDKIDLSAGFKTNVDVELKLFDKTLVDVYPIIQELAKVEPAVKTLLNIIDAVMGDTVKKALNDGVKAVLPDQQNFKINMGILIAQALKKAKAGAKAMAGDKLPPGALRRLQEHLDEKIVTKNGRKLSRRRLAADLVSADGTFNLGGIPKSSKPGSKDAGDPKAEVKAEKSTASTATGDKEDEKKDSEETSGAASASFFAALPFLFALF